MLTQLRVLVLAVPSMPLTTGSFVMPSAPSAPSKEPAPPMIVSHVNLLSPIAPIAPHLPPVMTVKHMLTCQDQVASCATPRSLTAPTALVVRAAKYAPQDGFWLPMELVQSVKILCLTASAVHRRQSALAA